MVVVGVERSHLLRRGLFVVAVAAAGWLFGMVFAGTAGADEVTPDSTRTESSGLLGGLLDGLTGTVSGVTTSIVDISGELLSPIVTPDPEPVVDLPSLLPASVSPSGSVSTDPDDASRAEIVAPVQADAPPAAPAAPLVLAPVPVAPAVVVVPAAPAVPDVGGAAAEHAGQSGSEPEPVKAPAAPAGSGATMSTAHDNAGGARGTCGAPTSQATHHPADAGFTTRSRAVDAAGRAAGLPASSPD